MTDPTDKKSKEKRDNLDVDLDAMLDEAESSLLPMNEFQDDEDDAIDRLLMGAGFDSDDAVMPSKVKTDVGLHDDLDDFLAFDDFVGDFNKPEKPSAAVVELEDAVGSSSDFSLDDRLDEEDALDRLLMNAEIDADELDELDAFSDFSDFTEPDPIPVAEADEPELTTDTLFEFADDVDLTGEIDDVDKSDRIHEDEIEVSTPAMAEAKEPHLEEDNVDSDEELDAFSDFSDFNEPNPIPVAEIDEPELTTDTLFEFADDVDLTGEIDDVDKSDRIHEDEIEVSTPAMAEAKEPDLEEDNVDSDEELDAFSDFRDFNEPDPIPAAEIDEPEQVTENLSANDEADRQDELDNFLSLGGFDDSDLIQDDEVKSSIPIEVEPDQEKRAVFEQPSDNTDLPDELDDFFSLGGFDESDLIQDDEVKSSIPTEAEVNQQQSAEVEPSSDNNADLPDEMDDLFSLGGFDESDLIQDNEVKSSIPSEAEVNQQQSAEVEPSSDNNADLPDEMDDLFSLGGFDDSDLIQDDEVKPSTPAKVEPDQAQPATVEPSSDNNADLPDEMDDFFSLGGFDNSDMIQDDEVAPSTPAKVEPDQALPATVEPSSDNNADLPDEMDDLFSLGGFDESDLIQDDEVDSSTLTEAEPDQAHQVTVEESFSDLQNDENSFDSLFMDSDFNAEDVLEQTADKKGEFGDDTDLSEIDEFFQLDEVSDDFSKETGEGLLAGGEQSIQDEDDFLLPDFDITADMEISDMGSNSGAKESDLTDAFGDSDFLDDDVIQAFNPETPELKPGDGEAVFESQPKQSADKTPENLENVKNSSSVSEQGDVKKQLEDAERRVKKAKLLGYIALGFGTVALSAAAGLGLMTYNAKSEVSKLTETVSTLEASLSKNAENNPNEEINAVMDSVVQLNQKVYGFITELKGNPQSLADLLSNKVPDIVAKQDMVSKALNMLQTKVGGEGRMPLLESLVVDPVKAEATHNPVPAKIEPAQEHASSKENEAHPAKEKTAHEVAPTKERAKHEEAPAKVEPAPEAAPVKVQAEAEPAKPVMPPKAILKKEEPVKIDAPTTVGKWGVNLVAFKQEWFARSKAAEFARQGIFAEVIPVHEKNTTMYRLRVGGFRTKAEANANTARIKQALNLDSVWVSDN